MVTLPTNFKVAKFERQGHRDPAPAPVEIDAVRFDPGDGSKLRLPVSCGSMIRFVPLAKWAMLLAGNYRCVTGTACGRPRGRSQRHRDLALGVNFVSTSASSSAPSPRTSAVREIRCRSAKPHARPRQRVRYRTGRPISSAPTSWQLIAKQKGSPSGDRCPGGAGRCAARCQSQEGGGLIAPAALAASIEGGAGARA